MKDAVLEIHNGIFFDERGKPLRQGEYINMV